MTPHRLGRRLIRTRTFIARSIRALQDRVLGPWYLRQPLDPNLVVYTNLWHRAPRGNPLAIYRKQQELAPHLKAVWIVRKQDVELLDDDITYVTPRTLAYLKLTATATYFVDDANPHWSLPARPGQIYVQTHHGTALKYMGADRHYSGKRPTDDTIVTMHRRSQRWTYSLTTSPYLTEVWERAYASEGCRQLEIGFPRNDVLVNATDADRERVRTQLGLTDDQRAVLYLPTWRTRRGPKEADVNLDALAEVLPSDVTLLVRDHYYHDRTARDRTPANVIDVSRGWEVEDLYHAADVMVTDYSSAMFDYALLDKPIVLFTYDWDRYRCERGAYFDVVANPPGPVVFHAADLVTALTERSYDTAEHRARRADFRRTFATYEDGRAAEKTVRIVLLGEPAAPYVGHGGSHDHPAGWTTHPPVSHPDDPSVEAYLPPVGPTVQPISDLVPDSVAESDRLPAPDLAQHA